MTRGGGKHLFDITGKSLYREGDGAACAVVNQLCARLILKHDFVLVKQQPILLLIDNLTSGSTIPYILYIDFPRQCVYFGMSVQI